MSAHVDLKFRVNWIAASGEHSQADWQHVDCCAAPQPLADPAPAAPVEPLAVISDDEWWPGRCIP